MLVFACIPFGGKFAPYISGLWGLSLLIVSFIKPKELNFKRDFAFLIKPFDIKFLLVLFWLIYAISGIWAEDKSLISSRLEIKLVFLLAPFFFALAKLNVKWIKRILLAFIFGNLAAVALNFGDSLNSYLNSKKVSEFIMQQFSELVHPSYWGMYLVFCIMICGYFIVWKSIKEKRNLVLLYALMLVFFLSICMVQSKSALVAIFFIPLVLIFWIVIKKGKWKQGLSALIVLLFTVGLSFYLTPNLQLRFANVYNGITQKTIATDSKESTNARLAAWKASSQLIKEKPIMGYGVGQEKNNLVMKYVKMDYQNAAQQQLDSHSQFLYSWISAGLLGLFSLFSLFVALIYHGYKKKNGLIILFSFLVFFSCLTESMFEAQSGVLFFVFFTLLLSSMPDGRKQSA